MGGSEREEGEKVSNLVFFRPANHYGSIREKMKKKKKKGGGETQKKGK